MQKIKATKPVYEKRTKKCVICGKTYQHEVEILPNGTENSWDYNHGACNRPRCILLRMRECI